jgi:hypothetical protein
MDCGDIQIIDITKNKSIKQIIFFLIFFVVFLYIKNNLLLRSNY